MVIWEDTFGVQEGRTRTLFGASTLESPHFSPIRSGPMTLVSIPANPVPEDVVTGVITDPRRCRIALRALGPAGGPQGHGLRVQRPQRNDREIFRDGARPARTRLRGGDYRLARAGPFLAPPARPAQGLCPRLLRLRGRRRNLRAAGGAAGLSATAISRWRIRWAARSCSASRMRASAGSTAWCCRRR